MAGDFDFLSTVAQLAAPQLLGSYLRSEIDGEYIVAKIVEVEAYDQTDAASHSHHGKTTRTEVMFGPAGHLYVYFTYGMHYCMNIVTGPVGHGAGVLIRALEPVQGDLWMSKNRGNRQGVEISNGPAKACQAFAVDKTLNGHDLQERPLQLLVKPRLAASDIVQTTRVGISQAKDTPWRFYIKNNPYVSKQ